MEHNFDALICVICASQNELKMPQIDSPRDFGYCSILNRQKPSDIEYFTTKIILNIRVSFVFKSFLFIGKSVVFSWLESLIFQHRQNSWNPINVLGWLNWTRLVFTRRFHIFYRNLVIMLLECRYWNRLAFTRVFNMLYRNLIW